MVPSPIYAPRIRQLGPHSPDDSAILTVLVTIEGQNSGACGESTGVAMADPTGEADRGALRLDFDRRSAAAILRVRGHLRCRIAALPPIGYRGGADRDECRYARRRAHRRERSPSVGRLAAPIAVRTAGRLRGRGRQPLASAAHGTRRALTLVTMDAQKTRRWRSQARESGECWI